MEFKYLNDGRKVSVIGQINNQEAIVQEVFVTADGDEIPSGERFVAKSLHDQPVLSYKAKEEERLTKRCEDIEKTISAKDKELKDIKLSLQAYKKRLSSVQKLVEKVPDAELEAFTMFLSGTAKYLVYIPEYGTLQEPVEFNEATTDSEWGDVSLKLLSVFGRSDGDLEYRVSHYGDGSGGSRTVIPCATYEDALDVIKNIAIERAEKGRLGKDDFDKCLELGIQLPVEAMASYKKHRLDTINKSIEYSQSELQKREFSIKSLKEELAELEAG